MIQNNLDIRQKISSLIAFTFIILLCLVLSWYSIKTSDEILANMPNSKTLSISKRMQTENLQNNIEFQDILSEGGIANNEIGPEN